MIESIGQEARRLHSAIYGPLPDSDWEECKDIWTKNIAWLRENQHREPLVHSTNFLKNLDPVS
jgi:hypothetical protein